MKIDRPAKLKLTDEEEKLLAQIVFPSSFAHESEENRKLSRMASGDLARSLIAREAIPSIRRRYFTDPDLNIRLKKSRMQVFEDNGTTGKAILEHGNFLPYLKYFIFGPELPSKIIDDFWSLICIHDGELEDARQLARKETRDFSLNPHKACDEFFKLALECGMEIYEARSVREAVKTIR
jgi:hypothetical protein